MFVFLGLVGLGQSELQVSLSHTQAHKVYPWVIDVNVVATEETSFSNRRTPFDTFAPCRAFSVYNSQNEPLAYHGPIAKRFPASDADLVHLKSSEELSAQIDLSECFVFEEGVEYTVSLDNTSENSNHVPTRVVQDVTFTSTISTLAPYARMEKATTYSGCSANEQDTTVQALSNLMDGLSIYEDVLEQGCAGAEFSRFFGEYSTDRFRLITEHYGNIKSEFQAENFNIVCHDSRCGSSTFAFVYPADMDHHIYLCPVYWAVSTTIGYDSKPGTLLHEMAHFDDVAQTNDFRYGVSGCEDLANRYYPHYAMFNSDSHEYYFEQMPTYSAAECDVNCYQPSCTDVPGFSDRYYYCADFDERGMCADNAEPTESHDCCICGGGQVSYGSCSVAIQAISGGEGLQYLETTDEEWIDNNYGWVILAVAAPLTVLGGGFLACKKCRKTGPPAPVRMI
jgi:peptidyl-Lys metalloendopeptidase